MHLMLNPFRRHSKTCPHFAKGRAYRQCRCVVWVEGTLNGQRVQMTLKTRDWKKAQDEIHEIEMAGKVVKSRGVKEGIEEFMADCRARGLGRSTMKAYRTDLMTTNGSSLLAFAEARGVQSVAGIDFEFLTAWRASWTLKATTQATRLAKVRACLDFFVSCGYLKSNPAADMKPPKVRHVPTMPFSREEIVALLAGAPEQGSAEEGKRLHAYILIGRYTGLRRRDIATLPVSSLNGNRMLLMTAKTGVPVFTVLPPAAVEALRSVPKASEAYWFWSGQSDPDTVGSNYARAFRRLCKRVGVKNGHLHRLRDTFAVELLEAGVAIEQVSTLLGHSSIAITQKHYAPWVKSRQSLMEQSLERLWSMEQQQNGNTAQNTVN